MAIATGTIRRRQPVLDRLVVAMPLVMAVALGTAGGALLSGAFLNRPANMGPGPIGTPHAFPTDAPTSEPTPEATGTARPSLRPTIRPTPGQTAPPTPITTPRPTVVPTPTPPDGPPACRYDDLLTFHHGLANWRRSLLDTIYALPRSYAPYDLIDTSSAGLNRGYTIRAIVLDDLVALVGDARAAGANLGVVSGYRSHAEQAATFQHWVEVAGYEAALRTSARAGHSEHQLGTTLDFTTAGGPAPWEYNDWATTREGAWMAANAWRYGFVMSYPRDAFAQTCYDYEPWHYRYVGRDLATRIRASGMAPRLVLWGIQ